jgi:prolipoprotein diacylglyceryltransferase
LAAITSRPVSSRPTPTASLPVYPTQLFESIANGLIFLALMLLWRRRAFPGQIFASYLLLYGAARFLIEYLRGDLERGVWFNGLLSTSQILSLISIAAGAVLWIYLKPSMPVRRAGFARASERPSVPPHGPA